MEQTKVADYQTLVPPKKARNDLSFLPASQNITMHQFQAPRQDFRALALDWMHGRGLSRPHRWPLHYGPMSVAVGRQLDESSKCVRKAEPLAFLQTALALDFQVFFIPVLETTESSCLFPASVKLMPDGDSQSQSSGCIFNEKLVAM